MTTARLLRREDFAISADWVRATRVGGAIADRWRSVGGPRVILVVAIAVSFGFFCSHVFARHDQYGTFDHDLGIWDQSVWLLSRGHSFNTVRGLEVFAFHASPGLFLLVPFYWLGAGPNFLDLVMVVSLSLGAIPVFLVADHYLKNEWQSLVLALAYLVNFAGQWMLQETFHPEVVAVAPFLAAYLYAVRKRWLLYALWLVLAVSWKEDVALAAFMLGFILAVRGERKVGLATMASTTLYFLLMTQVVVPALSPEGNFTEQLYGDLGSSPTEIAETTLTEPDIALEHLQNADAKAYVVDLSASYGFVSWLSPLALLISLPQTLLNLLAIYNFFWTPKVHYAAMPLIGLTIAMVEGVARPKRQGIRRFLVGAVAVGAVTTSVMWGIGYLSPEYDKGFWPLTENPRRAYLESATEIPGRNDSIAASYNLVPHMTHREEIYTWPNPWQPVNYGVTAEGAPDPNSVEWLLIDSVLLSAEHRILFDRIMDTGDFEVVSRAGDVIVAHRTRDSKENPGDEPIVVPVPTVPPATLPVTPPSITVPAEAPLVTVEP